MGREERQRNREKLRDTKVRNRRTENEWQGEKHIIRQNYVQCEKQA